jgi:hypothetical protein
MMPKQEILPPETNVPAPTTSMPAIHTGGIVQSYLSKRGWLGRAGAVRALAELNAAEVACTNQMAALARSTRQMRDDLVLLAEQPEKAAHDQALRRIQREDERDERLHQLTANRIERERDRTVRHTTLTKAKAELRDAETELLAANQKYAAQEKYGDGTASLTHHTLRHKILELELETQAKRRILRKLEKNDDAEVDILDRLYRKRDEANADGADTSYIDEEIWRREAAE